MDSPPKAVIVLRPLVGIYPRRAHTRARPSRRGSRVPITGRLVDHGPRIPT